MERDNNNVFEKTFDDSPLGDGADIDVEQITNDILAQIPPDVVGPIQWDEQLHVSAPNDTIPVTSLIPNNGADDVDVVVAPKGNGDILAQVPDGTIAGGNKRGGISIDLQRIRNSADMVASGVGSVLFTGYNNKATGLYAVAISGSNNTASGINSMVMSGQLNTASAQNSLVCTGDNNLASANNACVVAGRYNRAQGNNSFIGGGELNDTYIAAQHSFVGGGYACDVQSVFGSIAGGQINVVTGINSHIGGGRDNHADGMYSVVAGGYDNIAGGDDSFVGGGISNYIGDYPYTAIVCGQGNTVNAQGSTITGGRFNNITTTGTYALAHGFLNTVEGSLGFAMGEGNYVVGKYGACFGGSGQSTNIGQNVLSSGQLSTRGDAQRSEYVHRCQLNQETLKDLSGDGGALTTSNCLDLYSAGSLCTFEALVVASEKTDGGLFASWKVTGYAHRTVAGIEINYSVTDVSTIPAGWGISVHDQPGLDGFNFRFLSDIARDVNVVASIRLVETYN